MLSWYYYGLLKDGEIRTSHNCCACKFPFYSTLKLKELVQQSLSSDKEMIDDAIKVIDSTTESLVYTWTTSVVNVHKAVRLRIHSKKMSLIYPLFINKG